MVTIGELQEELSKLDIKLHDFSTKTPLNIEYISIIELPEKSNRIRENGLLLCTFHAFNSTEHINEHLLWLKSININIVGFHKAYYKVIPIEVLNFAKNLEMSLFEIPVDVPYFRILDIFNDLVNKDINFDKYEVTKVKDKILEAVYLRKSVNNIINIVDTFLDANIILLDNYLKVKSVWKNSVLKLNDLNELIDVIFVRFKNQVLESRLYNKNVEINVKLKNNVMLNMDIIPIHNNNNFIGYIIVDSVILNNLIRSDILNTSIKVIGLIENESNQNDFNLIEDVKKLKLLQSSEVIDYNLINFSFDILKIKKVIAIKLNYNEEIEKITSRINTAIERNYGLSWSYNNIVFCILFTDVKINFINEFIQKECYIGISYMPNNINLFEFKKCLFEAMETLKLCILYDEQTLTWQKLGIEKILPIIKSNSFLKNVGHELLAPIILHDEKKNSDLLITLKMGLKYFYNHKAVSKELYIHPNTVKYRLNQISELLNIDIYNYRSFSMLVLAIESLNE